MKKSNIEVIERELSMATSKDTELKKLIAEVNKNIIREIGDINSKELMEIATILLPKYNDNALARSILYDYVIKFNE